MNKFCFKKCKIHTAAYICQNQYNGLITRTSFLNFWSMTKWAPKFNIENITEAGSWSPNKRMNGHWKTEIMISPFCSK